MSTFAWRSALFVGPLLVALPSLGLAAGAVITSIDRGALNDTGQTQCVEFKDVYRFTSHCVGTGQDAAFGRDARARGNNGNGHAGFSFVKIGASGEVLPRDATDWACVHDNVTGLTWENKTHDGGLHDVNARFTNLGDHSVGDASAFAASVNAAGLCGATDWRLPSRRETESLVDFSVAYGGPMIDTHWFPDSAAELHWTRTSSHVNGGASSYRWAVNFHGGTSIWYGGEFGHFAVRLVRQGHKATDKRWAPDGGEVLDTSTGLVWRRCAEGQIWTGASCSGTPSTFLTFTRAIDHANSQAALTGMPWRTPNIKELSTLVDTRRNWPAVDTTVFPGFAYGVFHSATPWTENPVYSWRVELEQGEIMRDFWGGFLVLVRDAD